jgi:predicted nucleic acid-binding protein
LIVVDASLFIAWLLNEPRRRPEEAVWEILLAETALVPAHWPNEIANALRRAVRTKRIAIEEIAPIAEQVSTFDIGFAEPTSIEAVGELAKEALQYGLSAYDMIYVNLAREYRLPLATIDQAMRAAAQRLEVPLLPA